MSLAPRPPSLAARPALRLSPEAGARVGGGPQEAGVPAPGEGAQGGLGQLDGVLVARCDGQVGECLGRLGAALGNRSLPVHVEAHVQRRHGLPDVAERRVAVLFRQPRQQQLARQGEVTECRRPNAPPPSALRR